MTSIDLRVAGIVAGDLATYRAAMADVRGTVRRLDVPCKVLKATWDGDDVVITVRVTAARGVCCVGDILNVRPTALVGRDRRSERGRLAALRAAKHSANRDRRSVFVWRGHSGYVATDRPPYDGTPFETVYSDVYIMQRREV